jgi:hypothetical protein
MKRKWLIIGSLACMQYFCLAQQAKDTEKFKPGKTEIELVYNHYIQDGNHSAVTGGNGTEELIVYGPSLSFKHSKGKNELSFNAGTDVISSASTGKIDFVVSSASVLDSRFYFKANYARQFEPNNFKINGGIGSSIESDYFSIHGHIGFTKNDKDNLRTFSVQFHFFDDDLRWGRINPDYYKPVKLIYPQELRDREWFDRYKRNSYHLNFAFTRILNKRNVLGFFPEFTLQKGLLSTPFHRVYFSDSTLLVENLPNHRYKGALAIRLNSFAGGMLIFKNSIDTYCDNFGILALSVENETAIKVKPFFSLLPNFKISTQKASKYFKHYREHEIGEPFYTSDHDLASATIYQAGIGFKYQTQSYQSKKSRSTIFILRYTYFFRTDFLKAHILSLVINTSRI